MLEDPLATTSTEELLHLAILQPENVKDTLHAYLFLWFIKTGKIKEIINEKPNPPAMLG